MMKNLLQRTRKTMIELLNKYPRNVLFSVYNAVAHTHKKGLHDLYSCSYPRRILRRISDWGGLSGNTGQILTGTGRLPAVCRIRIALIAGIMPPVPLWSRRGFTVM